MNCVGLEANDMVKLRKEASKSNCKIGVYKNTLIKKAVSEKGLEVSESVFKYPTMLFTVEDDIVALAKEVKKLTETHESVEFKAAVMGQQIIDKIGLMKLAKLPSRDVLLGQLVTRMNTPIQKLVYVLSGPITSFVCGLNQIKEQKEKEVK